MEPDPPEWCWHCGGLVEHQHQSQTEGPVAAAGIELPRALSLQIAADSCSYIPHSWLFLIKGGSSHQSLKLLLSPSIFSPQELGPVFAESRHFWPPALFGASPLDLPQFDTEN